MNSDVNLNAIRHAGAPAPQAGARTEGSMLPPTGAGAPGAPPVANPSLHLDPALGLVVIEFRDEAGHVTGSIPSQRQIEAYHRASGQIPPASRADHDSSAKTPPETQSVEA
jgi:hypothetical protein